MSFIPTYITGNSLNSITYQSIQKALTDGHRIESRNGLCYELEDVDIILNSPQNRYLYLKGRTNNIFATLAEVFWVFGGDGVLFPIMTSVLPRCIQYSDDLGYSWRGNYSKRMFTNDQIGSVLQQFVQDGINTRRAVMTIWRPDLDSQSIIGNCNKSRDIPCTTALWFWCRENRLNTKVQFRSNDCLFGFSNINVVEWTILQEIFCDMISKEINIPLSLGYYHHSAISFHVYDSTEKQAQKIISNPFKDCPNNKYLSCFLNYDPAMSKPEFFRRKFKEIHDLLCYYSMISWQTDDKPVIVFSDIADLGKKLFGEDSEKNALYWYFLTVMAFLLAKNGVKNKTTVKEWFSVYESKLEEVFPLFHYAVVNSPFYAKNVYWTEEEKKALDDKHSKHKQIIKTI